MEREFRQCTPEDLESLCHLSRRTFLETFSSGNTPENMEAYLHAAFNREKLRAELLNPHSCFYFLYSDGYLAGYLKVNETPAQTDLYDEQSLEVERIYVLRGFQGKGLGRYLLDRAIALAALHQKRYVWLGVWENNEKALRFYKRNGFYKIGAHSFYVGDDEQTDYIMRRDIEGAQEA